MLHIRTIDVTAKKTFIKITKRKNMETINQKLNKLFKNWKEARHYDESVFVSDGLVYKKAPWKMEQD